MSDHDNMIYMIPICNPDNKDETPQNLSLHVHKPCYHVTFAKKICASLELSPTKTWIRMLFDALYHLLCLSMLLKFWDQSFLSDMSCAQNATTKKTDLLQVCLLWTRFWTTLFTCGVNGSSAFVGQVVNGFSPLLGEVSLLAAAIFSVGKVLPNFREGFMIILCNNSPIPAIKRNIIFQTLLEGAILVPKKLFPFLERQLLNKNVCATTLQQWLLCPVYAPWQWRLPMANVWFQCAELVSELILKSNKSSYLCLREGYDKRGG